MALWFGKLILTRSQHGRNFFNIPAMLGNSALQNFPGTCLPRPLFGNGGRHGKHLQFKIRKVGHNFRNSTDQLKNVQLKIHHGCRFLRSLTNAHALGNSASFSLLLRSGALSTRNTKNSLRNFEANGEKSDTLPCEFMDKRLLSVQAMQKVPASIATNKRSKETFVDDIQKQDSNSALKFSSFSGLQIQDPKLPLEKGSPRSSKSVSKTADASQRKKKGIQGKKSGHKNVDQPSMNNVVSGKSTKASKGGDSTKNPKAPVKKNQQTRKKKNSNPPSGSCQPLGTSEPLVSIKTSQGKRSHDTSSSQISKALANEIDQAGEMPLPVVSNQASEHCRSTAENSFEKKGAQKEVNAVKSEKIPAKKSKFVVQVLSSGDTPSSSTSKAGRASCAAGRVKADNCRVKKWNGTLGPLFPPNGKSVVVVESVTKASVIQKYLGDMFEVLPSYGHVRDLASRSGSVRPDDDFSMVWEVPASAWTHLKSIKVALKGAKNLILASDPDREGEAIAWHITEMLEQQDAFHEGITVARVTFCEVTESAVKRALQCPRDIDKNLVHAYLARRALDYLIGFNISPLLWRKLPGCQSAGRVQSAALALVCDREMEIDKYKQQEYWSVDAQFQRAEDASVYFKSQVTHYDSKKLDKLSISSEAEANTVQQNITFSNFQVVGAKRSRMQRNPPMPYITSSLQQDAANQLNFYTDYTMKLAQKLYEGVKLSNDEATGLITYMRTDGLHVSDEVVRDIGMLVVERYGQDYILKSNPKYFKVKNAQEAHEAIRPTNIRRLPSSLVSILDDDSLKLYSLIWSRTIASQMEPATVEKVQVDIADDNESMVLRSTSSRVVFPGYQAVYKDEESAAAGHDDNEENAREEAFNVLFSLKLGDQVNLSKVEIKQHRTEPPPRYSEASLVKRLEELGIGRPSTYASILKVLKERNYVTMKSRKLVPEFRGRMVSAFLSHHFSEVTDYSFTADMETELDNVSKGTTEWKGLLKDYWARFSMYCDLTSKIDIQQVEKMLEETYTNYLFASLPDKSRRCPSCNEGTLIFKVSRFGAGYFIGCDKHPKCKYIAKTIFTEDDEGVNPQKPDNGFKPKLLGLHPGSNEKVYVKNGPYGYYVQLGDDRKGYSPKRASILKATNIDSVTLEDALELLRYPLTLGNHPHDQEPVLLRISKFGFSVKHRRTIAPVPKGVHPQKVTLETALKYLASKGAKQCGRPKGRLRVEEAMEAMFSQ